MTAEAAGMSLEEQIDQWRSYVRARQAIHTVDIAELEDHLREQVAVLVDAGLATDEAFLVAVKRMGDLDALSREFAREHSDRLWKQLVVGPSETDESRAAARTDAIVAFSLAAVAAVVIKLPVLFGINFGDDPWFYARNLSLFVLPLLTAYFAWKRHLATRTIVWLAVGFIAAVVFANGYPLAAGSSSQTLTTLHLPVALWLAVGIAYAGGRWGQPSGRMNFVRFSGELFIYLVLIGLGGGFLALLMGLIFQAIGVDIVSFLDSWLLPCGAMAAILVGAWLVEGKQSVIENMAPVLTRLFAPLFAAVLIAFLGTLLLTGRGVVIDRNLLIVFDLLLVVVLALVVYSLSARNPQAPPGAFDIVQVALLISALLADTLALWAIAARLSEFGVSPNRAAVLGLNVILLVNLAWSAVLYLRFLRGRGSFASMERWQTEYLVVYAGWAAIVVIVFPPVFGFI